MAAFVSAMQGQVREAEMAGRAGDSAMKNWDWLAVAIGRLGGPSRAAEALNVSRQSVYTWLERGLGKVTFDKIYELHKKSDVPLEYLGRRLGPHRGPMELPKTGTA